MQKFSARRYLHPKFYPTWLGLGILRLLSFLPLPIISLMGQSFGMLAYCVIGSRRRIAYKNISSCFPEYSEKHCHAVNREQFRLVGQSLFTTPLHMWVKAKRFDRMIEITHREHYDNALAKQRNIILLAPHFVGIDVSGLALSRERKIVSMYQYMKNTLLNDIMIHGRTRYCGELIERKEPLRKVLRIINQGDPFYYLPDQDAGRKGIFAPFFNQLASTTSALGKFAQAGNSVVIPCHARIKPWGQGYEVILGEPLKDFPSGDEMADTTQMNRQIEAMIRTAPAQYFWLHKRFKTRPTSDPEPFY